MLGQSLPINTRISRVALLLQLELCPETAQAHHRIWDRRTVMHDANSLCRMIGCIQTSMVSAYALGSCDLIPVLCVLQNVYIVTCSMTRKYEVKDS